jgi:hypothetical protein
MFTIMRVTITNTVAALATACLVQGCATTHSNDDKPGRSASTAPGTLSPQGGGFARALIGSPPPTLSRHGEQSPQAQGEAMVLVAAAEDDLSLGEQTSQAQARGGGFASTCRRMSLSGTRLSAECKNRRGEWFRGPDLNLAQHIGNNDGQLVDHSANYQNSCGNCKLGYLGCTWVPGPNGLPFWECDYHYGAGCWDQGTSPFFVETYCLLACEKVDNNTGCRRRNGDRRTTSTSLEACIANYDGTLNWVCN